MVSNVVLYCFYNKYRLKNCLITNHSDHKKVNEICLMLILCVFLHFRWLSRVSPMTDHSSHCRQVTSKVIVAFWWLWAAVGAHSLPPSATLPADLYRSCNYHSAPTSVFANPSSTINRFACFITSMYIDPSASFFLRRYQCTKMITSHWRCFFTSNGLNMDNFSRCFSKRIYGKLAFRWCNLEETFTMEITTLM